MQNTRQNLTESEFLDQQAREARRAMASVAKEIRENLARGLSPAAWTRKSPWLGLGGAALAGFVAATVVTKPKRTASDAAAPPSTPAPEPSPAGLRLKRLLLAEVLHLVRPIVTAFVTAKVSQQAAAPPAPAPSTPETTTEPSPDQSATP